MLNIIFFIFLNVFSSEDQTCKETALLFLAQSQAEVPRNQDAVERMCANNYNGGCIRAVCDNINLNECDDMHEMSQIIAACSGNRDGYCLRYECENPLHRKCSQLATIIPLVRSCAYQGM